MKALITKHIRGMLDNMHYNLPQYTHLSAEEVQFQLGRIAAYEEIYRMLTGENYEYEEHR